jgi:phosphatidylglycerophosphate synthase
MIQIGSALKRGFFILLPNALSTSRIVAAPALWVLLLESNAATPILYFGACLTDVLDGKIARGLNSTSPYGSLLDAFADFVLIFTGFCFYALNGVVHPLLLVVVVVSFVYYIVTANYVIHSVGGRHTGAVLFVLLGVVMLFPSKYVGAYATYLGVAYVSIATIIRVLGIKRQG